MNARDLAPAGRDEGRRHSGLVAAGIALSRLSGLARERAIGHFAGTSFAADAFAAAVRIPNALPHLLGEGTLSAGFIPVYSRLLAEGREREAGRLAGTVLGLLVAVVGAVVVAGVALARPLTALVAGSLRDDATFDLTVRLVRIMFPAVGLLVVSAWCLALLNSHRRFFASYVAPVALNIVQIATLVVVGGFVLEPAATRLDDDQLSTLVLWLAIGTIVGGLAQIAVQLVGLRRARVSIRPHLDHRSDPMRQVLSSVPPVVGARAVVQLSRYAQLFLLSYLAVGALSTMRYAQTLAALPVALFGVSVAAAELPALSGSGSREPARLAAAMARIAAFVVPSMVGYVVIGDLITAAVLQSGRFGSVDADAVWIVLAAASIGLLAQTSVRLQQSALFAASSPRVPARASIVRVVVAIGLGALLMLQFDRLVVGPDGFSVDGDLPAWTPIDDADREAGSLRLGAAGLALGASIGAWVEYGLLRAALVRRGIVARLGGGELGRIAVAALAAALVALALRLLLTDGQPLVVGTVAVAATGLAYLAVAVRVGVTDLVALAGLARRRHRL